MERFAIMLLVAMGMAAAVPRQQVSDQPAAAANINELQLPTREAIELPTAAPEPDGRQLDNRQAEIDALNAQVARLQGDNADLHAVNRQLEIERDLARQQVAHQQEQAAKPAVPSRPTFTVYYQPAKQAAYAACAGNNNCASRQFRRWRN